MKGYSLLFSALIIIMAVPSISPWQLFQSMCPYLGAQSPQCQAFMQQLQQQLQQQQPFLSQPQVPQVQQPYQPYQQQPQQQQPIVCPDGSIVDSNGNCPVIQQQQPQQPQP